MKRTRQVFHYGEDAVPSDISGCRMFHGEDLPFADRQAQQAEQQRQWVLQQKQEKHQMTKEEIEEEKAYAEQTLAMTRMRGMLEDEMSAKRAAKLKEIQQENKRLALEKKQREDRWRQDQERLNQNEIADPNQQ